MTALADAAALVENAWCKSQLVERSEDGDRFCAVGALVQSLLPQNMAFDGLYVGLSELLVESPEGLLTAYDYIDDSAEGAVLAEVIRDNYPDRLIDTDFGPNYYVADNSEIIFTFNDHQDTTREDVVAMLTKANLLLEDRIAFEDKTAEDLVAEIDELLD